MKWYRGLHSEPLWSVGEPQLVQLVRRALHLLHDCPAIDKPLVG